MRKPTPKCKRQRCNGRPKAAGLCFHHLKMRLDSACRARILERDGHCVKCGYEGTYYSLQWAHIITRAALSLRWAEKNSVTLCGRCHLRFTLRPDEWEAFIEDYAPGLWNELHLELVDAIRAGDSPDWAGLIEFFGVAA